MALPVGTTVREGVVRPKPPKKTKPKRVPPPRTFATTRPVQRGVAEAPPAATGRVEQSPDAADRAAKARKANLKRGAAPSGGPGRREVKRLSALDRRIENMPVGEQVAAVQQHLVDQGFDLQVDGVWGPLSQKAWTAFAGKINKSQRYDYATRVRWALKHPNRVTSQEKTRLFGTVGAQALDRAWNDEQTLRGHLAPSNMAEAQDIDPFEMVEEERIEGPGSRGGRFGEPDVRMVKRPNRLLRADEEARDNALNLALEQSGVYDLVKQAPGSDFQRAFVEPWRGPASAITEMFTVGPGIAKLIRGEEVSDGELASDFALLPFLFVGKPIMGLRAVHRGVEFGKMTPEQVFGSLSTNDKRLYRLAKKNQGVGKALTPRQTGVVNAVETIQGRFRLGAGQAYRETPVRDFRYRRKQTAQVKAMTKPLLDQTVDAAVFDEVLGPMVVRGTLKPRADKKAYITVETADGVDHHFPHSKIFDVSEPGATPDEFAGLPTREDALARLGAPTHSSGTSRRIAGEVKGLKGADGKELPLPTRFERDADELAAAIERVFQLARDGYGYKDWYDEAAGNIKLVADHFGLPVHKVAQVFAITSQAAEVIGNTTLAIKAIKQHLANEPISSGRFPERQSVEIEQALGEGKGWEGRKRSSFYMNMIERLDPAEYRRMVKEIGRETPVTVDMWIVRMFAPFLDKDVPDRFYQAFEEMIIRMAAEVGMDPKEFQAAAWVAAKKRGLLPDKIRRAAGKGQVARTSEEEIDRFGRDAYHIGTARAIDRPDLDPGVSVAGGRGDPSVRFTELDAEDPGSQTRFREAFARNAHGWTVGRDTLDELGDSRVFLSEDESTGFAISPDGEVHVHFSNDPEAEAAAAREAEAALAAKEAEDIVSAESTAQLLKGLHSSLAISFHTDAPYNIGKVSAERIGYADIPSIVVPVHVRAEDVSAVIPIVRQHVYRELAERGWSPDDIEFRPTLQQESHRRRKFTDTNERSESTGKQKMGQQYRIAFEIVGGRKSPMGSEIFKEFGTYKPLVDNPNRPPPLEEPPVMLDPDRPIENLVSAAGDDVIQGRAISVDEQGVGLYEYVPPPKDYSEGAAIRGTLAAGDRSWELLPHPSKPDTWVVKHRRDPEAPTYELTTRELDLKGYGVYWSDPNIPRPDMSDLTKQRVADAAEELGPRGHYILDDVRARELEGKDEFRLLWETRRINEGDALPEPAAETYRRIAAGITARQAETVRPHKLTAAQRKSAEGLLQAAHRGATHATAWDVPGSARIHEAAGFYPVARLPFDPEDVEEAARPGFEKIGNPDVIFYSFGAQPHAERTFTSWEDAERYARSVARPAKPRKDLARPGFEVNEADDLAAQGRQYLRDRAEARRIFEALDPPLTVFEEGQIKDAESWLAWIDESVRKFGRQLGLQSGVFPFGSRAEEASLRAKGGLDEPYEARTAVAAGGLEAQLPRSRSRLLGRPYQKLQDAISKELDTPWVRDRTGIRILTTTERVIKAAGRAQRQEIHRRQARVALQINEIARVKESSDEDVAHYWYAQLPTRLRNPEGIRMIKAKQEEELRRIVSGEAQRDLIDERTAIRIRQAELREEDPEGSVEGVMRLVRRLDEIKRELLDLPLKEEDVSRSIARLDQVIEADVPVNEDLLDALKVLAEDRTNLLVESGRLSPERAFQREKLVANWLEVEPDDTEIYMGHRLPRTDMGVPMQSARGGVGRVASPQGLSENRLILAESGRLRPSTRVTVEDWQQATMFDHALQARDDLGQLGVPFRGRWLKDHVLINKKGHTVPAHWRSEEFAAFGESFDDIEETRLMGEEIVKGWAAETQAEKNEMLTEAMKQEDFEWDQLRLVPKRQVERYYAQYKPTGGKQRGSLNVLDMAVDAAAVSIIFARVGYIPKNIVQNLVMAVPHQGAFLPVNAVRMAQVMADPELRHLIRAEIGNTANMALLEKEGLKRVPNRALDATATFVSKFADEPARMSAFIHECAAADVISSVKPLLTAKDREKLIRLLTDKSQRRRLNDIHRATIEAMGDFGRLTPDQARMARRLLIIPGWLMAGTRYPFHFAINHPIRSALIAYAAMGEPGAPDELRFNEPITHYFHGRRWLSGIDTPWGRMRTQSLNPVSMPWEIAHSIVGSATGRDPFDYETPVAGDFANPILALLAAFANGEVRHPMTTIKRLVPNLSFIEGMLAPEAHDNYPEDVTRWGRLQRELGVVPIEVTDEPEATGPLRRSTRRIPPPPGFGGGAVAPLPGTGNQIAPPP